jgi:hypothetical protein
MGFSLRAPSNILPEVSCATSAISLGRVMDALNVYRLERVTPL